MTYPSLLDQQAPFGDPRLPATFWQDVEVSSGDRQCWLYTRYLLPNGYGQTLGGARQERAAHRVSYTALVGPIAPGLQIDHLCKVRNCVNPVHLEAVTPRVNVSRSSSPPAANAAKTHCKYGHELTPENVWRGRKAHHRLCKICQRKIRNETRRRHRERLLLEGEK